MPLAEDLEKFHPNLVGVVTAHLNINSFVHFDQKMSTLVKIAEFRPQKWGHC